MTKKERYYWDLNGHLVVRNVLSANFVGMGRSYDPTGGWG